jgi:hypothetical protein
MATAEDDFRKWFVESLAPLRSNGDAGFVFAMVAFPLLERYLRNKSGCPEGKPLKEVFFQALSRIIPDVAGREYEFLDCYRNGLLHQVTFSKATIGKGGIWVDLPPAGISGYDSRPVYFDEHVGGFFLNPIKFFDRVAATIQADFSCYEGSHASKFPLPTIAIPGFGDVGTVPTINFNLPTTGLHIVKSDPGSGA